MCLLGTGSRIQVDYHLMCVVLTGGAGCVCGLRDPGGLPSPLPHR